MGRRMLRTWIDCPLQDLAAIETRQEAVKELFENTVLRMKLREHLDKI